mgnify:CR=1 FL=1
MKVAIDISASVYGTGVSVYTINLVKNLLSLNKKIEYVLCGYSFRRFNVLKGITTGFNGNFESKLIRIPPTFFDYLWNNLHFLRFETFFGKVDVYHSSDWIQAPSTFPKITTIHDIVPLKYPKLSHPNIVEVHQRRFKWVKKEVDVIVVPSNTTKKDITELGIEERRIRVVPEAADPIFKPVSRMRVDRLKRKYRISGKYILSVGITPRKNNERIIEAFEKFRPGLDLKLVIIGEPKHELPQRRNVIFTGYVPNDEMPIFYSGAEALVYPSLYEGFGLPILEAFSCKTPVVTSFFGSMLEVADGAAILVDPYDVTSIKEGISKALEYRKKMITIGLSRVKQFSWKKIAAKMCEIYKELK